MLEILYEDNHIIAVNKKVSDIVHSDKSGDKTLADEVKAYIKKKYNKPGDVYLGVPHRIDRPVSGIVIFARTSKALTRLNEMFQQHGEAITKIYWAVVGNLPPKEEDTLTHYMIKNEEKNKSYAYDKEKKNTKLAQLKYKLVSSTQRYYLLEITLLTGRHHQIRCQLAKVGMPIRGDLKYGAPRSNPNGGISLHARKVSFIHPVSKERIEIIAPVSKDDVLWNEFMNVTKE